MNIIVKKYEHYNRSMGKYISSRAEYENEMAKGGYIPFEKAEVLAEQRRKEIYKPYNGISEKALKLCKSAKDVADRKGNIKPSDRLIDGMRDCGVNFYAQLPKHYQEPKGGFDAV